MEGDGGTLQFALDEGVAVEPIGGVERKETSHPDDNRSQHLIPDVEVVVRQAAALVRQDAVVGVLGGVLGNGDTEGAALLHALEDEVGAALLHAA